MSLSPTSRLGVVMYVCIIRSTTIVNAKKLNKMNTSEKTLITIKTTVNAPVEKVWERWIQPDHITKWNFASDDWHSPWAKADLQVGGKFSARMEAKDGSFGFDFGGTYDVLDTNKQIVYTIDDGRKVDIQFVSNGNTTEVIETFEAETTNPVELQQQGWQAILDNFKKYAESN